MVNKPSSRTKHYLTGMDWIVHGYDYMNKRSTGVGNVFQIVVEVDGVPEADEVREALERFVNKFPVINGRWRRDFNLAPYWKIPSHSQKTVLPFTVHTIENGDDVTALLERGANRPFGSKREHLACQLIRAEKKSYVSFTFDHCLFDARGAEAFLSMFQEDWEREGGCSWEAAVPAAAELNQWRRKFEAGREVNRAFLRLAENAPPRVLPLVPGLKKQGFKFNVLSFDEQESKDIAERAEDEAGYLMAMPYTMALSVQVLHEIFRKRGIDRGDYIIPVTMDTSPARKVPEEVFFNHVSMFLFRIRASEVEDASILLKSIKQQMYDQVRSGLTKDIWEASFLTRIFPLPILSYLMRIYLKGEVASFCFSFVGETEHTASRFMGKEIQRSYHMTRVPLPPGLGVFFQQSRGRLNAYLSYAQGLLREDEVDSIVDRLRSKLGGGV